ncbi:MAG TPA: SIS domain-containing protein, partial [Oscillatoriaceae cyanobacterium]
SGNTGETTACLRAALERGVPVVAVSHGGEVTALGAEHGFPVVSVPGGWMPRAALGDLFFALLGLISQLPCCEKSCDVSGACCQAPQVAEATAALRDLRDRLTDGVPTAQNPAKQLALLLHGKTPILVGATSTTEAVALRWKCQINENSKQTALLAVLPEMTHNDIVNLTAHSHADHAMLVFTDPEDSEFVTRQRRIALELLKPHLGAVELLTGQGDTLLSRQLTAIYLGDYVSVYLAFLNGVDPTPVDTIFSLKARMQATSEEVHA